MKLGLSFLIIWTFGAAQGQYQHAMQYQNVQRQNQAAAMRMRSPLMASRTRWPQATNQVPTIAQRPYKPLFMYQYMKNPSQLYRTQKPLGKAPSAYPSYFKTPLGFRTSAIKDMFRTPPSPLIPASTHQLSVGPASAQKLLSATSPIQNLIIGPSPVKNLLIGSAKKPTTTTTTPKYFAFTQTSQPLIPSVTPIPSVAYPIRVDGEGGPIHTIPAPNLSLADKPIIVPDFNYLDSHANKCKAAHTYEVTEDTNEKVHPQATNNKVFSLTSPVTSNKLYSGGNYFSSVIHPFLPQPAALKSQPIAPSLTSQQLFALLGESSPQQQLADTYTLPLVQQPQLQQHFFQSYNAIKPLPAFSAVYQPQLGGNAQENVLFKPDPAYIKKIQEQFSQTTSKPDYTTQQVLRLSDSDKFSAQWKEALKENSEIDASHYNVVRNTQEGIPRSNATSDSDNSATFHVENKVNFTPLDAMQRTNDSFDADAVASMFLSEIDSIATSSLPPEYIKQLKNNNIQTADLINSESQHSPVHAEYYHSYYGRNSEDLKPISNQHYSNDFTPNNGFPFMQDNKDEQIRILIPEQYDDIDTQPTENIQVSASLDAVGPKNDMTIVFDNSDYQYDEQVSDNSTSIDTIVGKSEKADDVVVSVPQNTSNPTLDILTKDWKTSIVIKPKPKINNHGELNQITEFGSRIKTKQ